MDLKLGHVAIRTSNMEKSLHFYLDILGMQEAFRMYTEDGSLATVYVYIAPGQFLELFTNGKRHAETGKEIIGLVHVCLEVPDIQEAYALMQERGAPIDSEIRVGKAGCLLFWLHDPDGNPVELMELPPESLQAQAAARFAQP